MNDELIKQIKEAFQEGRIYFTKHSIIKMDERNISHKEIKEFLEIFEIIETYPEDKPFASFLAFGKTMEDRPLHCVLAFDYLENQVIIITSYEPDIKEWQEDFKTRR